MAQREVTTCLAGRPYLAGDIYSFRTSPATEVSPRETGRIAALKIIGFKGERICIAVLDGIFNNHHTLKDVKSLPVVRNRRFKYRGEPAVCFVGGESENLLEDVKYVGSSDISPVDVEFLASCRSYSAWTWANSVAEGEWRWKHDRASYVDEVRRSREALLARMSSERMRQKARLRTLTWEALLEEQPFPRWDRHPPFPPLDFVVAARQQIHSTVRALQVLAGC